MDVNIYEVKRLDTKNDIIVEVPGSKSITNRALLLAALSNKTTILKGTLFSDDSRYFLSSLKSLGFFVDIDEGAKTVVVKGNGGKIPNICGEVYVGSAGTAARFLTAMLGLSGGKYTINSSEQMKKRPMKPLFEALETLGVNIEFLEESYQLPVRILGREKTDNKEIVIDTTKSTQFLSALLMTGFMNKGGLSIKVTGDRKTGSYVNITTDMMKSFGYNSQFDGECYYINENNECSSNEDEFIYQIEPDVSGACYFYGIAAIKGIKVIVKNVHRDSTQGDIKFLDALEKMGCLIEETSEGISVTGPSDLKSLKGIEIDMNNFSDQALTMAAISIFANSPTTIKNVGHIRLQESDRIKAIANALENMGIKYIEKPDEITIYPGTPNPCEIETYEDHRVAMAFTLPGLMVEGIKIINPMCCRKTFENYFEIISSL